MKQIIAMGGGGFGMDETMRPIQKYIIQASGVAAPKMCLIPTAGADKFEDITQFYDSVMYWGGHPSHLSLFRLPTADLESFLLEKDIIFVGGGNTRSMMALWREWDLFRILRLAYEQGVLLSGVSAGGNCWFEDGVTTSVPGVMGVAQCSGILEGSFCPHYDSQPERRPAHHRMVANGEIGAGYGVDEAAALHMIAGEAPKAVRFGPNAHVFHVAAVNGQALETPLDNLISLID